MKKSKKMQSSENPHYSGTDELWGIEKSLKNYNQNIINKISRSYKKSFKVMEFGAGIGTLANILSFSAGIKPDCVEIDPNLRSVLSIRGFNVFSSLDEANDLYDAIYTSNVLEHIEEDVVILKRLYHCLKPGSSLSIYVPAFNMLYSSTDAAVGHFRRYSKSELSLKLESAGFTVEQAIYSDSIGFFIWLMLKIRGKKSIASLSNSKSLEMYDRFIFPLSNLIDILGFNRFVGKNLFIIARKI